jgi:hypothetical protein
MSNGDETDVCDFCGQGKVIKRDEEIAFEQQTDRGPIHCRLTVLVGTCDHCGAKSYDEAADAAIAAAVRAGYDNLG